jgi:hypothetical protein
MRNAFTFTAFSFLLMATACGQPVRTPGGTIEGKAIPDKAFASSRDASVQRLTLAGNRAPSEAQIQADMQQQICGTLRGAVQEAATENAIRDLGITVTPEEETAARAAAPLPNASQIQWYRDRQTLIPHALAEVYEQGQDQHQVFLKELQPHGFREQEWDFFLSQGKTPEGRAKIAQQYQRAVEATQEVVQKGWGATFNPRRMIEKRKLDAEIDRRLSLDDPQFRVNIQDYQAKGNDPDPKKRTVPVAEARYLDSRRAQWWQTLVSKMSVVLNDPTLKAKCGLAEMGVR